MPKYEVTHLYSVWYREIVEADDEEDAFEKATGGGIEIEREHQDCQVEEV